MSKIFILVGMESKFKAFHFMNEVVKNLIDRGIDHVEADRVNIRVDTANARVWFVCPDYVKWLDGIRADALFGKAAYRILLRERAKPDAENPLNYGIGLVDYICMLENKSWGVNDPTKKAFRELVGAYCRLHKIPALLHVDYHNGTEYKFIIQHEHKHDTAIHVIWSEVEDIDACLDAVLAGLKKWSDPKQVYITTSSESRKYLELGEALHAGYTMGLNTPPEKRIVDTCPSEMWPSSLYITMGRQNGKSLYRHLLNATYGKCPDIHNIQSQLYVELMKGKSNMNNVMHDIHMKKPAYIVTESGQLPVCVDEVGLAVGEPITFRGHVRESAASYVENDVITTRKLYERMAFWKNYIYPFLQKPAKESVPVIKNVIFSGPCTVVIWEDDTKTVVRCNNEDNDPEKGLAMAIAKKALGTNKSGSNYYDIFKKWLPKAEEE